MYVVETDIRGGRQERRWAPQHRRNLPTSPQAERQPAEEESQADVSGQCRGLTPTEFIIVTTQRLKNLLFSNSRLQNTFQLEAS